VFIVLLHDIKCAKLVSLFSFQQHQHNYWNS